MHNYVILVLRNRPRVLHQGQFQYSQMKIFHKTFHAASVNLLYLLYFICVLNVEKLKHVCSYIIKSSLAVFQPRSKK